MTVTLTATPYWLSIIFLCVRKTFGTTSAERGAVGDVHALAAGSYGT